MTLCHGYWEILPNYAYMYQCIHIVTFCSTYIPYMNLGVYILWLFVLPTYGTWIKVYIYIATFCPTYIHVKQKYKLWLFVLRVLWLSVRLPKRKTTFLKTWLIGYYLLESIACDWLFSLWIMYSSIHFYGRWLDFCGAPLPLDALSTCLFCLRGNPGLKDGHDYYK